MKVTHIWSVLCGQSVINSDNNEVSLLNVLEHLDVNALVKEATDLEKEINIPINYELVSFWINSSDAKEVKGFVDVSIRNPKNEEKHLFSNQFVIPTNTKRLRTRLKINGLVVKDNGIYNFVVKFREEEKDKSKEVAILPLEIVVNKKMQVDKVKITS